MNDRPIDHYVPTELPESFARTNPKEWLAAIVESSDDAIIGKSLDSLIQSWNEGAVRMFGYEPDEIIGQPVYILIPPKLHYEEPDIIARLVRGERVDHYETVRLRKDGTRLDVSLSVSPIRDASGRIVGAAKIVRDITEAKRLQRAEHELTEQLQELAAELEQQLNEGQALQQELERTNRELNRSLTDARTARDEADAALREAEEARQRGVEANASKNQFLATMSHELRTPLNAIAGYVELLELGIRGPLNDAQRQDLQRIKRSEAILARLVENVLNFAKLETGRLEFQYRDVRLNDVLDMAVAFVAPRLARKGIVYRLERCADDLVVPIDRDKVQQILLNLLSNAVKFTDEGSITVRCTADAHDVRIDVEDTGRGVRPELLETIFEPFVQGDHSLTRTAEGTGLGLSISRQLARGMGGNVTVKSTVGKGSTFTLVLPRKRETVAPS